MWILAAAPTGQGERIAALEATVQILKEHVDSIDLKLWGILLLGLTQLVAYIVTTRKNSKGGEHHG